MTGETVLRRFVLAVWVLSGGMIAFLSLQPGIEMPVSFWNADKVYHCLAYAWLGGLPLLAFSGPVWGRIAAWSMVGLGLLLEWGQSLVPGRTASLGDALANAVGVLLGILAARLLLGRLHARRSVRI